MSSQSGGYSAVFVGELQPRHKCTICFLAMRSPVQTGCGHLFCKKCLEPELQRPDPRCPVDQERISRSETFPDNACKREILSLLVMCDNHSSGCIWTGELKSLESHLTVCEYRLIKCSMCGESVLHLRLSIHTSSECPKRPSQCDNCGKSIPNDSLESHRRSSCPSSLHECPNECNNENRQFTLVELKKHLEVKGGDCPLHQIPCPFYDLGCSFKCRRKDMGGHIDEFKIFHSQLTVEVLLDVKTKMPSLAKTLSHVEESVNDIETKVSSIDKLSMRMDEKFDHLENKRDKLLERLESSLKEQIVKLQIEIEGFQQRQLKSSSSSSSSPYVRDPFSGYSDPATTAFNSTLSQRVDHLFAKVNELDHTVNTCLNHNLDCDVRIQLLERATYDGTFLWKIDNYAQRRREAINGTTLSLYSSPFYTSRQGYKMCARIYLNGDGSGKNTHLSFFFCVMRGPNDALLPWPFQQKVTLLLMNQNGRKNIVDQFRPDTQSSSFQRPIHREMNIASGCPLFCPLSELHNGFIKEDCIFLGVIVDTVGIPRPIKF